MYSEYGYEPTDLEDELFLSEVPAQLLQESIENQFQDPLEYRRKDYIQSFITKYEFSKENMLEDDLLMLELTRDKFMEFLEDVFDRYLSIGLNDFDNLDTFEQNELVHQVYRFFIKNIKKNFVNIVINFIDENKDEILSKYERKKDVTVLNFKSEIDSEFDIIVLSNLGIIIKSIFDELKELNDVDEFLHLCESDDIVLELEAVKNYYEEFKITGNFIPHYIKMIDESFLSEIQSKVRNKILKKYPNRERKAVEEDITEN